MVQRTKHLGVSHLPADCIQSSECKEFSLGKIKNGGYVPGTIPPSLVQIASMVKETKHSADKRTPGIHGRFSFANMQKRTDKR